MKAAIVLDTWKLEIFQEGLNKRGFPSTTNPGVTENTSTLIIELTGPRMTELATLVRILHNKTRATKN